MGIIISIHLHSFVLLIFDVPVSGWFGIIGRTAYAVTLFEAVPSSAKEKVFVYVLSEIRFTHMDFRLF